MVVVAVDAGGEGAGVEETCEVGDVASVVTKRADATKDGRRSSRLGAAAVAARIGN